MPVGGAMVESYESSVKSRGLPRRFVVGGAVLQEILLLLEDAYPCLNEETPVTHRS